MSHMTNDMYIQCFKQMQKSVDSLFRMKHFSSKMKSNQNIYITNLRDAYMMIYKAGKWNKVNKEATMSSIYNDLKGNLEDALEKMREKSTIPAELDRVVKWFWEDDLDHDRENRLKKESYINMSCNAYNNREYPMQMKLKADRCIKNARTN